MWMLIGYLLIGKTDAFDDECIKTRFLVIGLPLFPVASFYVTPSERRSAFLANRNLDPADVGIWTHTPIPMHAKSIRSAYVLWWGFVAVMLVVVLGDKLPWAGVWFLAATLVWTAFFIASMTSKRAMRERSALASATGVGAWPEIQYRETTQRVFNALSKTWLSRHEEENGQHAWRDVAPADVKAEDLPDYYALCRYARALEGDSWTRKTAAAWERLDAIQFE